MAMGTVKFPMFIASTVFGDFILLSGYHFFNRWIRWNGWWVAWRGKRNTSCNFSQMPTIKTWRDVPKLDGIGSQVGEISSLPSQRTWPGHHHKTGSLPETNSSPLKIDPWKRRFLLETTIFEGRTVTASVREGTTHLTLPTLFLTTVRKVVVAESWIYPTHYQALAMKRVMVRSCFGGGWLAEQP